MGAVAPSGRPLLLGLVAVLVGAALVTSSPVAATTPGRATFAAVAQRAQATLLDVYYVDGGSWRACNQPGCPTGNRDWGDDALTYALALRFGATQAPELATSLDALAASAPTYPAPCAAPAGCGSWSDVPEWDSIALADEYLATGAPNALAKAEAAFAYVAQSQAYALGACPQIPYQQPGGGTNDLKTLETEANAVKAALLLFTATRDPAYLAAAQEDYEAARRYFLDPSTPLYTVYVFDDGQTCTPLPHRFFASVNGDMIWSGVELHRDTGNPAYLEQAAATAGAVDRNLSDPRGIFTDLQAENDTVEPLVEGMQAVADAGDRAARSWILRNAAAALGARARDGSYGRFFDGPPPTAPVTAWQTNGGLALEMAAATLAPATVPVPAPGWSAASRVSRQIDTLPATIRFRGSGIALIGTLGEHCCESGHARVLVDGRETFDRTGIWQDKSSLGVSIPGTVLFAWRWPTVGLHTLTFEPGAANPKEGGAFLHLSGYEVLRR